MGCLKWIFILYCIGIVVKYPMPFIAIGVAYIYFAIKICKKTTIKENEQHRIQSTKQNSHRKKTTAKKKKPRKNFDIPKENLKVHTINFKYGDKLIKNRDFQVWLDGQELCFFGNLSPENLEMKQYIKIKIPTKNINFFTRIGDMYTKGKDREVVDNRETTMEVIDDKNEITYLRFNSDAYEIFLKLIINKEKSLASLRKARNG